MRPDRAILLSFSQGGTEICIFIVRQSPLSLSVSKALNTAHRIVGPHVVPDSVGKD